MDSQDIKMDNCGGKVIRRYVSWCVDSDPASPSPETPSPTVPEFSGAVTPSLIGPPYDPHPTTEDRLSLLKPSGGPETPLLSQQPPLPPAPAPISPYRTPSDTHPSAETSKPIRRRRSQKQKDVHDVDEEDEGQNKDSREPGSEWSRQDPSLLHPGDCQDPLPHSAPVITRRRRKSPSRRGDTRGLSLSVSPHTTTPVLAQEPNDKVKRSSDVTYWAADLYKMTCDLEKENAHFVVVDMVLEVLEGVKWTLCLRQTAPEPITESHAQLQDQPITETHAQLQDQPITESHSQLQEEASGTKDEEDPLKTLSVVSTDSGFEECEMKRGPLSRGSPFKKSFNSSLRCPMMPCSAETLAEQLVLGFRKQWFPCREPRGGCRRPSLRTSLQELPGTVAVVCDASLSLREVIRQRTRMRGTLTWAPPRFQIIYTVHPSHRRSEVIAAQHFLCAGCGTEIEPRYIKKLRYCDYFGKYFCDCCHSGSESVIPGRVLTRWDFSRRPVSDFSKQLLDSVWHQPLFDLSCIGQSLYSRVRQLDRFRDLQERLLSIKRLLAACRLSGGALREFDQLPGHLTRGPHLFSMDDLLRVKRGQLVPLARAVLRSAVTHVESCELCLARGFICEFCRQDERLFPFQSETCTQCKECRACFHSDCFRDEECPKCVRIKSRRKLSPCM